MRKARSWHRPRVSVLVANGCCMRMPSCTFYAVKINAAKITIGYCGRKHRPSPSQPIKPALHASMPSVPTRGHPRSRGVFRDNRHSGMQRRVGDTLHNLLMARSFQFRAACTPQSITPASARDPWQAVQEGSQRMGRRPPTLTSRSEKRVEMSLTPGSARMVSLTSRANASLSVATTSS